jgi:integrase
MPSLWLVVSPTGRKWWYVRKKVNGRPRKIKLADFEALSIDGARGRAAEVLADIARGIDPSLERQRIREETTFGELFSAYLNDYAKARKKTWKQDERRYELHLKPWASRRLGEVTRADVFRLHARIGKDAPYEANRVAALVSKVYSFALKGGWEGTNPVRGLEKFKEQSRSRFLSPAELRSLMGAINAAGNDAVRDVLRLLILTAQRRGNVLSMRWAEVDLESGVWTIPAGKFKGHREHRVSLPDEALSILRRRAKAPDRHREFVFPGRDGDGPLTETKRHWRAIVKSAGLDGVRIHDIRRTWATWAIANGTSVYTVKDILGHKDISTTEVYARLQLDSLRDAMNATSARLMEAAKPDVVADVPALPAKSETTQG